LLYVIGEAAELLTPFIPETCDKIKVQLESGERSALFPRIDIKKELENLAQNG
jgi:vacuolar-type H+-ATPase subunit D/Vma8